MTEQEYDIRLLACLRRMNPEQLERIAAFTAVLYAQQQLPQDVKAAPSVPDPVSVPSG